MAAQDPADAAQTRMGRLCKSADVDFTRSGNFHALRSGKIRNDREFRLDPRAVRLQVGHEVGDTHERYDGRFTDAELTALATAPLPPWVNRSILGTIEFQNFSRQSFVVCYNKYCNRVKFLLIFCKKLINLVGYCLLCLIIVRIGQNSDTRMLSIASSIPRHAGRNQTRYAQIFEIK